MINNEILFNRAFVKELNLFDIYQESQLDLRKVEENLVIPNSLYNRSIELEDLNFIDMLDFARFTINQVDFSRKEVRAYIKNDVFFSYSENVREEYYKLFNLDDYQVDLLDFNYYLLSLKNYNYYKIEDKKRDIKTFVKEPYSLVLLLTEELFDGDEDGEFILIKDLRTQKKSYTFIKNLEEELYNNKVNYINLVPNFSVYVETENFIGDDGLTYEDILNAEDTLNSGSSDIISNFINVDVEVDYSDKNNFVKYGSAKLLLNNFVNKIFSIKRYNSLSGYERYLFKNWTKKTGKAYQLESIENLSEDDFYYQELSDCIEYDSKNYDRLLNVFIPEYLIKEDNIDFINFVDFIGNIYDGFRTKSKLIKEKYKIFDFSKDIMFLKNMLAESNLVANTNFDFEGISNTIMAENKERVDYNIILRLVETIPFLRASKGTMKSLKALNNIYGNYFDIEKSGEVVVVYRFDDGNSGEDYISNDINYKLLFENEESTIEYVNNDNFLRVNIEINDFLDSETSINDAITNINSILGSYNGKKVQSTTLSQIKLLTPYRTNFRASKVLIQSLRNKSFEDGSFKLIDNTFYSEFISKDYITTKDICFVENELTNKNIANNFTSNNNITPINGEINTYKTIGIKSFISYDIDVEQNIVEKFGRDDVKIDVISSNNTRVKTDES